MRQYGRRQGIEAQSQEGGAVSRPAPCPEKEYEPQYDGQDNRGQARPGSDAVEVVARLKQEDAHEVPHPVGAILPGWVVPREVERQWEQRHGSQHFEERGVLWIEPAVAEAEVGIAGRDMRGLIGRQRVLPHGAEQQEEHRRQQEGSLQPHEACGEILQRTYVHGINNLRALSKRMRTSSSHKT
jgi:hypothetical protein